MTKTGLLVLAVTVAIIWFFAQALFAMAQAPAANCADAAKILGGLEGKYHESPLLELMAEGNAKFQLFGNPETGTWSLVAFQPNGQACIILGGTSIEPMAARAVKPKGGEL